MEGCQYNEIAILDKLFPPVQDSVMGAPFRYVVDVGAADGIDNSNSYELLNRRNAWRGLLVEPHPGYFMDLLKLYTDSAKVKLSNYAIADTTSRRRLGLDDQCSSLVYPKPISIEVQCVTLTELFGLYNIPEKFDFLSVDCEGVDMEVLHSLDWKRYRPKAVCVEHAMSRTVLNEFMDAKDYKYFDKTMGNTFFVRK